MEAAYTCRKYSELPLAKENLLTAIVVNGN